MRNWEAFVRRHLSLPDLKPEREQRIIRELANQFEDIYRDALCRGLTEDEADILARQQIRNWEGFASDVRRADRPNLRPGLDRLAEKAEEATYRRGSWWQMFADLQNDVVIGLRTLRRNPGFTALAVFTLALCIGANTAVFSVVESVLLRSLPYPAADRLVIPRNQSSKAQNPHNFTYPDFMMWQRERVFESIAIFGTFTADLTDAGDPARATVREVGEGYFETIRMSAALGRTFQSEDHVPGTSRVALLGEGFWNSRFAADPAVLGRTIRIADMPHTIVGVAPSEAAAPRKVDVWTPMQPDLADENLLDWDNGAFTAVARLKEGESIRSTNAVLAALAARVAEQQPALRAGYTSLVLPMVQFVTGTELNRVLWVLLGTVCFVLLIGCVNIANLVLTLDARRGREYAVRSALGAGRFRLIRQQLTEGFLLAVGGGIMGVVLSYWLVHSIVAVAPRGIPRIQDVQLNGFVLLFTLAISTVSGWIFSLAPALKTTGGRLMSSIKEGMLRSTASRGERRSRQFLIGLELALSLTLLAGAGYALQSLHNLTRTELGFDHKHLLQVPVTLPGTRYESTTAADFFERIVEEAAALPGVESATTRSAMPIGGGGFYLSRSYLPEGRPEPPVGEELSGPWTVVGLNHFRTMGIPLLRGRDFSVHDDQDSLPVVIVNQRFAEMMFGDEEPLGKRVRSWRDENINREIIGVVGNVRYYQAGDEIRPSVYVPHRQNRWRHMNLVIRTTGDPADLIPAIRKVIAKQDPDLVVAEISTMDEVFAANLASPRFLSTLLLAYAAIAVLLSVVGIYGVLSYLVSLRTREIGVRVAVGAGWGDVIRMIIGDSLRAATMGMLAGLAGALALGRILQSLLFEVSLIEPHVILGGCAILIAISLLAGYIPAARAAGVDPVAALRSE